MGWLKKMLDDGDSLNLLGSQIEKLTMLRWGNTIEENNTLPSIWHSNIQKNIPYLQSQNGRVNSALDFPDLTGKAVVLVGASPVLNETWQYLKDVDDRFVIVASNSSAKFLVEHGIVPDYVLMIDGQKGQWSLDIGEGELKTAMIASPFCEPETLSAWKGKIYVLPYEVKNSPYNDAIKAQYGDPIPSGGNSINCGMAFFVTCTNAKIYLFAGNEMSFKKSYYLDRKSTNDNSMYFFVKDVDGETSRTLVPLYEYKIWLENLAWELYRDGYWFCNCSKGILGIDDGDRMDCISQMRLDTAIQEVKKALDFEKQDEMTKCKQIYDHLYHDSVYFPRNGIYTWLSVVEGITDGKMAWFDKGLDVGCGAGAGMLEAIEKGLNVYGVDIADNKDIWNEMGVADRCKVAPAHDMPYKDNEFDFIMCADVLEHVPQSYVDQTFREIFRVGSDRFLFAIAVGFASSVGGAVQTHHTVAPAVWWGEQIEKAGYKIVHFQEEENHHVIIGAVKEVANG